MDEHQITDRVEGGKAEPGITDRPPDRSAYAPPPAAPPRRKWRWWMPVAILVLMGGLIAYLQFGPPPTKSWDAAYKSFSTTAACVLTGLLLYAWFAFFSGFRWRMKLLLAAVGFLCVAALLVCFRMDGATGDMGFHYVWRWSAPADAGLPGFSDGTAATPADATIRPGDFPQFLGPDRDAVVHGVFLDPDWNAHPPREVWRQKVGAGWGAFAVAGDLAITQEQRGDVEWTVARDRKRGETVWSHGNKTRFIDQTRMGGDGPRATPTVAGSRVFAHGATGILDCLDAPTGKLLWSHPTLEDSGEGNIQWGVSASPLVIDDLGLVVVSLGSGGQGGTLAAYDIANGNRKWIGGTDKASYASPLLATLDGMRQIVSVNDASVTGHDPADGKVLWEYGWQQTPAKASQPPVLPGDRLLISCGYGPAAALLHVKHDGDKWTAEEEWTTSHMRTKFTTPVVRDHYAYGLDDGALTCIDLDDDGKQVWQAPRSDRFGHGQVLLVEDLLIVQAEDPGDVVLVEASPKGFHKLGVLHAFPTKTWNNPALAGNHLFVRNDQEAACYELATVEKRAEK